jgi:hypothetical protein
MIIVEKISEIFKNLDLIKGNKDLKIFYESGKNEVHELSDECDKPILPSYKNKLHKHDYTIDDENAYTISTYIKRFHYNKEEIIVTDEGEILFPQSLHELIVYSYLYYSKISCVFLPKVVSGYVMNGVSNIMLYKYGSPYKHREFEKMSIDELKIYIFQILVGCLTFNKFGIKHNDLHTNNIVQEYNHESSGLNYKIGGACYTVNTDIIYKIIDYEYSCITTSNDIIMPHCVKYQVEKVKNFNFSSKNEPSIDFLTFLRSLIYEICVSNEKVAIKMTSSEIDKLNANDEKLIYISLLIGKYYKIESWNKLLRGFEGSRVTGEIVNYPIEPILDFFDEFKVSEISDEKIHCFI